LITTRLALRSTVEWSFLVINGLRPKQLSRNRQ
jgi:hypothetical protein